MNMPKIEEPTTSTVGASAASMHREVARIIYDACDHYIDYVILCRRARIATADDGKFAESILGVISPVDFTIREGHDLDLSKVEAAQAISNAMTYYHGYLVDELAEKGPDDVTEVDAAIADQILTALEDVLTPVTAVESSQVIA